MELIVDLQTSARHAQAALFSPDGAELITVGQDPAVKVWTVPDFELARSLDGHDKSVNCAALTGDSGTLVTGSTDRTVRVWDYRKGTLLRTLKGHTNTVAGSRYRRTVDGRRRLPMMGRCGCGRCGMRVTLWCSRDTRGT